MSTAEPQLESGVARPRLRGRALATILMALAGVLFGWACHIYSYDPRRAVIIGVVASLTMALNVGRLAWPEWSLPQTLRRLSIGTALIAAIAVATIAIYLYRADAGAQRLEDPVLTRRWQAERRSLPALAGAMLLLATTTFAIPGRSSRLPTRAGAPPR